MNEKNLAIELRFLRCQPPPIITIPLDYLAKLANTVPFDEIYN